MTDLINKLLSLFHLKLVYTKPDTSLVKETVKFMNDNPKVFSGYNIPESTFVGEINYVKEYVEDEFLQVSGTTYFQHQVLGKEKTFYTYEGKEYTPQELQAKLND